MDGNSLNITNELLERFKTLVPQAFSEDKLDIQKLQTLLGEAVNTDNERYQLSWAGKSELLRETKRMKIQCGEKHFAEFDDVRFQVVGSVGELKTL